MPTTKEIPVISSTVSTVSYSKELRTMYVRFKNKKNPDQPGVLYSYTPVGYNTFLEMLASESKGKFLNENIKKVDDINHQKISE